jgi:hypothetical protein
LVPRAAPNIVCTVFAANALLDAYELTGSVYCLDMATSAADYLLQDLFWTNGPIEAGFSYPLPGVHIHIYNADLLGAAFLCRVSKLASFARFLTPALKVARYAANKQGRDGHWSYGELPDQRWIDNFHTGYNLMALRDIETYCGISEFSPHIRLGFEYYMSRFFRTDGAPRYFSERTFPIDVHSVAQSIITLLAFRDINGKSNELANSVLDWAMNHLWSRRGYFYYQVQPAYINRVSYMRWSQAWMILALSAIIEVRSREDEK